MLTGSWVVDALVAVLLLLYWHRRRNFFFWQKLGVPYLKPASFLGNMCGVAVGKQLGADPIYDCYLEDADAPYMGLFLFGNPLLLVKDPQLVARVLSTDFPAFSSRNFALHKGSDSLVANSVFAANGDRWKTMRDNLAPAFAPSRIEAMFSLMEYVGQDLVQYLTTATEDGKAVDMRQVSARYAAHVLCTVVLGSDAGSLSEDKSPLREHVTGLKRKGSLGQLALGISYFAPQLFKLLSLNFTEEKEETFFYFTTIQMMNERRQKGIVREDMVDMLMRLREGQTSPKNKNSKGDTNKNSPDTEMDDETIVGNIVAFIVSGFETSVSTMTYALYELAVNQEIQDRVGQDTREAVARHGGHFTCEALEAMSQLDNVIDETMRLHPPMNFLERKTTRPFQIPGTDVVLPKDTGVVVSVLGLHHDPRYWRHPERFLPDRFTPEGEGGHARPGCTFLPFGEGPRQCLGWRVAHMQIKIALAKVLLNFRVAVTEKTPEPPSAAHKKLMRRPAGELELRFQKLS